MPHDCLMDRHLHLLLERPDANLSKVIVPATNQESGGAKVAGDGSISARSKSIRIGQTATEVGALSGSRRADQTPAPKTQYPAISMTTITLPKALARRLEKASAQVGRCPDAMINTATAERLDYLERRLRTIEAGFEDLQYGAATIEEVQVGRWFQGIGDGIKDLGQNL